MIEQLHYAAAFFLFFERAEGIADEPHNAEWKLYWRKISKNILKTLPF